MNSFIMTAPRFYFLFTILTLTHGRLRKADSNNGSSAGCLPPGLTLNGSSVVARPGSLPDYSTLTEVNFSAELPAPSSSIPEKRLCKIKCIDGRWVGPLCRKEQEQGRFQPLLRSCKIDPFLLHLVLTYKNITLNKFNDVFPHGAFIQMRCREPVGLYKLLGESKLQCNNGAWSSRFPSCIPTTILTNYTEDSPPTILVKMPVGSASVEPSGELAVFPGSVLHLECLFPRKIGSPDWTWTTNFRQYLTGWAIAADERDWKYRLSIHNTKSQDSGVFTCNTPKGVTNSISINVISVHCNSLEEQVKNNSFLTVRIEGNRLGQNAIFQCSIGYKLNGTANLFCQASGEWSSLPPSCEPILCPDTNKQIEGLNTHLIVTEQNTSYGGRVLFSCPWGFRLIGSPGLECELNGTWSGSIPTCEKIECPKPVVPTFGRMVEESTQNEGVYGVGDVVQFACLPHARMSGEPSIVCTETGIWSQPTPLCKPGCEYPGEPENGLLVPLKFWYEVGDKLQVSCQDGFVTPLQVSPVCLDNGSWDPPMPNCTDYREVGM